MNVVCRDCWIRLDYPTMNVLAALLLLVYAKPGVWAQTVAAPQFTGTNGDSGNYVASINQNDLNGHHVIKVQCTIPQSRFMESSIRYDIVNSGDNYFDIDQNSGLVTLTIGALSFPSVGVYSATVSCHISRTQLRDSTTLNVEYTMQNEYPPIFTNSDNIEVWINEDRNITENELVVTLNATDQDLGECGKITYGIYSGNVGGVFSINLTSGRITLRSTLDYETTPEYELAVRAVNRRCRGPSTSDATTMVLVHVVNINDEPPHFSQHIYNVSIDENQAPHNFVQLTCSDADTDSESIIYVREFQHKPFMVDPETGNVSATKNLDYEQQRSYALTFACIDLSHPDRLRDEAAIYVEIVPINEFRPVVRSPSSGYAVIVIQEDTPAGTLIASALPHTGALINMTVVDQDHGVDGKVMFTFANTYDSSVVNQHFALDTSTGNLTLTRPIAVDQCPENYSPFFVLVVLTACDIPGGSELCPNIQIRILVVPSECIPSFTQGNYEIEVNETEDIGTLLQVIPCELPKIVGEERDKNIEIAFADHEIYNTFSVGKNGALTLHDTLDYEQRQNYTFLLRCYDSAENEVFASVEIFVQPDNDNEPYFNKSLNIFNITDPIPSTPHGVGTVQATDEDLDYGNTLQYSITTDPHTYFSVAAQNGSIFIENLSASSSLQRDIFLFDVEATDGAFTATTTILILLSSDRELNNCGSSTNVSERTDSVVCGTMCYVLLGIVTVLILSAVVVVMVVILRLCRLRYQMRENIEQKDTEQLDLEQHLKQRARLEPPVNVNPAHPPTFSREYAIPTIPDHNKEVHYHYVKTPHLQVAPEHQVSSPRSLASRPEQGVEAEASNPHAIVSIEMDDYLPMHTPSDDTESEVLKESVREVEHCPAEYELPQPTVRENIYEHIQ